MLPLVDIHCHLLPGLDDGPASWAEALAMCRIAWDDGTRAIAATAHQNENWPGVTPNSIRNATQQLAERLQAQGIPLAVYPCAEVMVGPEIETAWEHGQLLSMSDLGQHLLIEMPHGLVLDLRGLITNLIKMGVRPILAHPERHPELMHDNGIVDELILRGCLIQVSADSITQDRFPKMADALRAWARRGVIHLIGSDGHSPTQRLPGIGAAYGRLAEWVGFGIADRICSINGMAILEGLPLETPRPRAPKRRWLSKA